MTCILLAPSKSGHTWTTALMRSWGLAVHALEAIPPQIYHGRVQRDIRHKGDRVAVINIRDYLSYSASWIRYKGTGRISDTLHGLDTWHRIAREAMGETEFINDRKEVVYYDMMVRSPEYRRAICGDLGGTYTEEALEEIPTTSPGSSFDGFTYQGRGSQMDVLERWRWFMGEGAEYVPVLLERPGILQFYLDRFPVSEEKRQFLKSIM